MMNSLSKVAKIYLNLPKFVNNKEITHLDLGVEKGGGGGLLIL